MSKSNRTLTAVAGALLLTMMNAFGVVAFNPATSSVDVPNATITLGATGAPDALFNALAGSTVTVKVNATGNGPLTYAWFRQGVGVGGNQDTLVLNNVAKSQEGVYWVRVTDADGPITSARLNLGVMVFNPANSVVTGTTATLGTVSSPTVTVNATDGGSATFKVNVTGTGTLSYQWFKDSGTGPVLLNGRTASSLVISALKRDLTDEGLYFVRILEATRPGTNSAFSGKAQLRVQSRPKMALTGQPKAVTVNEDTAASFTATLDPTSTGPFTYRWQKNNVDVPGGTFAGVAAHTHTFTIPSAQWTDQGTYRVLVSNPGLTTTTLTSTVQH